MLVQVYDLDESQSKEILVFLSNGRVAVAQKPNHIMVKYLREGLEKKKWFSIVLSDERKIQSIQEVAGPLKKAPPLLTNKRLQESFRPSILKDIDQARTFFYQARTTAREESQCYDRAHVWSYEWRINHQLYSSKAWLFFTKRFIRKYKFEWWFHVAPMIHVIIGNQVKERIMDVKYARGPIKLKQWTDIFLRNKAQCPVVEKYSDQANYPESGSCFVMKSSMYTYQPKDLENEEVFREVKTRWIEEEVRHAYKEGFDIIL